MLYEAPHVAHHRPMLFQRPDRLPEKLSVCTTLFNPARYRSRWRLYEDFALHMAASGVELYTCEIALGNREFVCTQADNPQHLQLRTQHVLWYKEQAVNLLVQRLPHDWTKMAYIDADLHFVRGDWANETLHALEEYPIVQMWSQLQYLDAQHHATGQLMRSFVDVWCECGPLPVTRGKVGHYHGDGSKRHPWGAPGGAWALRREAWDILGGLIDYCILGAADYWMACALTGQVRSILDALEAGEHGFTPALAPDFLAYQHLAETGRWHDRPLVENVGLVAGLILHHWHGPMSGRQYTTRGDILNTYHFDRHRDLKRVSNGLYGLTDRVPALRRAIQRYFAHRDEDAT
jgi:hypothetical protein